MALPLKEIRTMLADSIKRTSFPVPMSDKAKDQWADGLGIPRGGETVLYTGALYQLMPYTKALMARLEGMEEKKGVGFLLKVASSLTKMVDLSGIASKVVKKDADFYNEILTAIAQLLSKAGVQFGCLYEDDVYSGALLYDLGLVEDFKVHARKVYDRIKEAGVRRVITVDPHTLHMFRTVFPSYIDDYELEAVGYLEVLSDKLSAPPQTLDDGVVIHDPCFYARFQAVIEQPRVLLRKAGIECQEARWSGEKTFCCGGPMESIAPHLSNTVAEERLAQLKEKSNKIVTLCPVCHIMLNRVAPDGVEVSDIATLLKKAWLTD